MLSLDSLNFHQCDIFLQVIYDLLERSSGHLELREDPDQGITVAGLKRIKVFPYCCKPVCNCIFMFSLWEDHGLISIQ